MTTTSKLRIRFEKVEMKKNKNHITSHDVVGVGNAIVDVIAEVDDSFIVSQDLVKGSMNLVDAKRSIELYSLLSQGSETPGGSAANSMVGVAELGGSAAYIGKISNDSAGGVFKEGMSKAGVIFSCAIDDGLSTARSIVLVTPDAQRTMNTFLGASAHLAPENIDEELVSSAGILYCEGYLWDTDESKDAIRKAMQISKSADRKVALALSDTFCVERHREDWLELLEEFVDLLFCNEKEICSFYETDDLDEATEKVSEKVDVAFVTLGSRGSLVVESENTFSVKAVEVDDVVDSTGAGDMFASGVIFGIGQELPLITCAEIGSIMASEVITELGCRLKGDAKKLIKHLL